MSIERQAVTALKWTVAARMLGQLLSWASTLLVLRLLEPADYGLMAIVATLTGIAAAVAEFGLGVSMIQARELERSLLERLAGVVIVFHLAMTALMVALAPLAAWFFQNDRLSLLIQVASVQFLFAAAAAVPQALAVRAMNFPWLARTELASMVAGSMCSLALALQGAGVWALVGGMLAATAARSLMLVVRGHNVRPSFRFAGLGAHLGYSSKMASSNVLWMAVSQSDVIVGGRLLASDALGLYSVALHLATLPMNKIMGSVNQVVFAAVARLQEDSARLRMRLLQGTRLTAALSIGIMWGAAAVAPELVRVVIGSKWEAAIVPLQLIALVVPLRMFAMLMATAVGAVGAANVNLRNTLTAAAIWPLCFVVGAQWGAIGLAAAWLAASPLTFAWNARRIGAALGLRIGELMRSALAPAVAGGVMVAAINAVRFAGSDWSDLMRLPLLIASGALGYVCVLFTLDRRLWPEMRKFWSAARG